MKNIRLYNLMPSTAYKLNLNMQSKKWSWNSADTKKLLDEAWKKSAPYLVVIIPVMLTQIPDEWAYGSFLVFVLQRIYSASKLLLAGK